MQIKNTDTTTLSDDGGAGVNGDKSSNGFAVTGNGLTVGQHTLTATNVVGPVSTDLVIGVPCQ